jgi:hypothetical protein
MNNVALATRGDTERVLSALSEQLAAEGHYFELVVVGGSALLALGLTNRTTRDVDVLAIRQEPELLSADPLPDELLTAVHRVARDFRLPENWLNHGPTSALKTGLPHGFVERLERRSYGPGLTVYFASRFDLIHLKLHAAVDGNHAKHEADLRALAPTAGEIESARDWVLGQDTSPLFPDAVAAVIARITDVDN